MTPGEPTSDRGDFQGDFMAVTAQVKDRVGRITLDRPPDNSYDAAFLEELDGCVGQVAEAVAELAAGLAAGAPLAVAAVTRLVNDGLERPLVDALDRELEEPGPLLASEDAREGLTAAAEGRPPTFNGR